MRVALTALLTVSLCNIAHAKPLAVIAEGEPTTLILWDSAWLERVGGEKLPADFPEPTEAELCEQGSSWFISLIDASGAAISPGAYYAVTEGEATVEEGTATEAEAAPDRRAFMYVALPSGPIVATRGALVVHSGDAHAMSVTMAAYVPFPPDVAADKTYSYSASFEAKACADLKPQDGAEPNS